MDFHFGRRLLVLGFVMALVAGAAQIASAIEIQERPEIRLYYDQEKPGHNGNEMISIGDTIQIWAIVTPPESADVVTANLCKYGGAPDVLLEHTHASATRPEWVPRCSDALSFARMTDVTILAPHSLNIKEETWLIWWDRVDGDWLVVGTSTGPLPTHAQTGVQYTANIGGEDVFRFTITDAANICCDVDVPPAPPPPPPDPICDHFTFVTHPANLAFVAKILVQDADTCWIDHNPCWYEGHWDATVLVTACDTVPPAPTPAYCDTMWSWWPGIYSDGDGGWDGDSLWVDTHWTKYVQLSDPAGYAAEFREDQDYTFTFYTTYAGLGPVFGLPDSILNPSTLGLNPDVVCAWIDMRKLSHENGNDDIDSLYFDLSALGDAWTDPLVVPTGDVNDQDFWFTGNPAYYEDRITCSPPYNGWPDDEVLTLCWNILPGQTDVGPRVEYIEMYWISDSGDTTYFFGDPPVMPDTPSNKLLAIDNRIPAGLDPATDISFVAAMDSAGNDDVLNPESYGYPTPDWALVKIDLAGMTDLNDVHHPSDSTKNGQIWANMMGVGQYMWDDDPVPNPFDWDSYRPMAPMSPVWGTDETDVIAAPPSPYAYDQDSIETDVYVFDNAGNGYYVGEKDTALAIDNRLPILPLPDGRCFLYPEIKTDVAFKPGYADVGFPLDRVCPKYPDGSLDGTKYNDRDEVVLHADFGEYFPPGEIVNVDWAPAPYDDDPYCVGGVDLVDDGTHGSDPVAGDQNYHGHFRVEVGGTERHDTTFCRIDTDEGTLGFDVLATDNAGNAAINSSCNNIKYDNEVPVMSPENVSIRFWDNPETFGIDGDVNHDGIVDTGDQIVFAWAAQADGWGDTEIDRTEVRFESIDPSYVGPNIALFWYPSGGIYTNCSPDPHDGFPCNPWTVIAGTIDGGPFSAEFAAQDNAGNITGWCRFESGLTIDNFAPVIDCDMVAVEISGPDDIASIGDALTFTYTGDDTDVSEMYVRDLRFVAGFEKFYLTKEGGVWSGSVVVIEGTVDTDAWQFFFYAVDDVGNVSSVCPTDYYSVDNQPPAMGCENAWLRLWDYNDVIYSPRIVNVGDNLTAIYYDVYNDVDSVKVDFSNYYDTETIFDMVPGFQNEVPDEYLWGWRVDPLPAGHIDQPPGGQATMVKITAWDDAGNMSEDWFCPKYYNETVKDRDLVFDSDHHMCDASCLAVDNIPPEIIPPDAITFELLEDSNGIANVGDRLRIIVNMGDPTEPGYDMEWRRAMVQCDIGQYGDEYYCHHYDEPDPFWRCDYLFLTDDGYSAFGEGDGKFSYFFLHGDDVIEGAPILPGSFVADAGDTLTEIRVRAMDDAGNFSPGWTKSAELVDARTHQMVPVDNFIPVVDPADISVTFVDNDSNGICDLGDDITVSVDMTDAPGGPLGDPGMWADLYDWGWPTHDLVPLEAHSPVYSITFTAQRNPGDFCPDQPDGPVGFEDQGEDICGAPLKPPPPPPPAPRAYVRVLAKDVSDNWSGYEGAVAPDYDGGVVLAGGGSPMPPHLSIWPFLSYPMSSDPLMDMLVDTDAPDPVNPTFPFSFSAVKAEKLVDGRIGIHLFYQTNPRNRDVDEFFVFGDLAVPGEIDWNTFLGEPIFAGTVPTGPYGFNLPYEWISDVLPERPDNPDTPLREDDYHFAILAVDNAGNTSDPDLTWITGISADATAPKAYVEGFYGDDMSFCTVTGEPTNIGNGSAKLLAYLDEPSEYRNVCKVELWARVHDLNPATEDLEPGEWRLCYVIGDYPAMGPLPVPPYEFSGGQIWQAFGDVLISECMTFDVAAIPWDEAGNHWWPDLSDQFVFTLDPFAPMMTMFAINGNPSPYDMELPEEEYGEEVTVEIAGIDECPATGELTYSLYLSMMGDKPVGQMWYHPLLTRETITDPDSVFTYHWDLTNYPEGDAQVEIYVCDQAGNWNYHWKRIHVIDRSVPDGVFAGYRRMAELFREGSHPYYTRLLDGQSISGDEYERTWFWVEWPDPVTFMAYDIEEVRMEYRMGGALTDDWTLIGVQTAYEDTLSWEAAEWAGYEFIWDTRIFQDGDPIELKATIMDHEGNTKSFTIGVTVAAEAPILALTIPEATEACGENKIKGAFNIIGTETSDWIDTYFVSYIFKKHEFPDLGDCNPMDTEGWIVWGDTLMLDAGTTDETIWRGVINPDSVFMGFEGRIPTFGMPDGMYDIALVTVDVAGNWSWDRNDDWCVDAGYFAWAVANRMGMTVTLQNEAPEVRIRTVNNFGSVDQPWPWPQPVYVQKDDQVTVTSWTERTCDVAKVEYWLAADSVVMDDMRLVAVSTEPDDYSETFPETGGVEQYLVPGALQHGYVIVDLVAKLTDVLGNESYFYADMWILDTKAASAIITSPAPASYIRHEVALEADAIADDEVYSVTYCYRPGVSGSWIPIATTKPHDGDPWNTDVNNNTIYWNTDLVPDGAYQLAAVAKDADLMDDPNPPAIRVVVDNHVPSVDVFNQTPKVVTSGAIPPGTTTWIGGPTVELTATVSDFGGNPIKNVKFWQMLVEQHYDDATLLFTDNEFPYAYTWDGTSFTGLASGWYDLIAEAEDMAGNLAYKTVTVYIDQWAPEGWITKINSDETPDGSNFNGVLAITGWCKDDVPMASVANQKYDSGLKRAQFQYRPFVQNGNHLESTPERGWIDLGGVITNSGPTYTINWDTGTLVPGTYELRIVGIDNVNNRADVDGAPMLAYVCIDIVDMAVPQAIVAGVDKVTGYIWAIADTHDQDDISFVRFEYATSLSGPWTVIGEVDTTECHDVYGIKWHFAQLTGTTYYVRAVAYDDNYHVVDSPDLYDKYPATMQVALSGTGMNKIVTMATTGYIFEGQAGLDRWGNLDDYDEIAVKVTTTDAAYKPTVLVTFDDDPEDHFNKPRVHLLDLERPDDQKVWVDGVSLHHLGDWGVATIIASYNYNPDPNIPGQVGARTNDVKMFRVTDREGTKGFVSQDGMSVDIPSGAMTWPSDGLMIIKVPNPVADPDIDMIARVGQTVQLEFLDYENHYDHDGGHWRYDFANGLGATVTLKYDLRNYPKPAGIADANLRVASWCEHGREWEFDGITNVTVNTGDSTVTFFTTRTGAFAVVAYTSLRITDPIYVPGCGEYTGRFPVACATIEDRLVGIDTHNIKVVLDGPQGRKMFDNFVIWNNGTIADGFDGGYNSTSGLGCVYFDEDYDWDEYWHLYGTGAWKGLPGGTYYVTISAMNTIGDMKTVVDTVKVDATKPTVSFAGTYIAANPSFVVNVADAESKIDPETIFLDVYQTGYGYVGTATPSGMTYDVGKGTVTFNQMTFFDKPLNDGMSIDVVVYDAGVPYDENCAGNLTFEGCSYCRDYCVDQGIADCAQNHANPVWRRYTVDTVAPLAGLVDTLFANTNGECGGDVTVAITDATAGLDPEEFVVWVNGGVVPPADEEDPDGWEFEPTDVTGGIIRGGELTLTVDCICAGITDVEIKVKSVDMVGNYKIMTDNVTFVCEEEDLTVSDLVNYPNPFDPWKGMHTNIRFDLSKSANVTIKIFDFAGEQVATLVDHSFDPGVSEVPWYGTNDAGEIVGTGAYIGYVKIDDGEKVIVKNLKIGVASLKGDVCEGQ